jgi:hypothetical protein
MGRQAQMRRLRRSKAAAASRGGSAPTPGSASRRHLALWAGCAVALAAGGLALALRGRASSTSSPDVAEEKKAEVRSAGLEQEPNDTPAQARPATSLKPASGDLARYEATGDWGKPGDVDCFRVPLRVPPAGAVVRLELRPPAGGSPHLRVLSEGEELLAEVTAAPGHSAIVPALGARSWETSYVACITAPGATSSTERYVLQVRSWSPKEPFEFEPNDTRETASALPRGAVLRGYLLAGDVDWYRLSHGPEASLQVTLEVPAGLEAELVLRDSEARELGRAQVQGGHAALEHSKATYVELRALGETSPEGTYLLRARGVPSSSLGQARP